MNVNVWKILSLFVLSFLWTTISFSAPSMAIQGRIAMPSGAPLEEAGVKIRVQVLSPNANECILFDETHTVDLSSSSGLFSLGLNDGNGTRNDLNGWDFASSLSNLSSFSVNAANCTTGSGTVVYSPSSLDERKMAIFFQRSGYPTWEEMTDSAARPTMGHSAFALESRKVGGFASDSLCRVANAGVPQSIAAMTSTNYADLLALIAGTSSKYTLRSASGGTSFPSYSGAPAMSSAGDVWYDTTTNKLMYNNGTVTPQPVGGVAATNPTTVSGYGITDAVKVGGQAGALKIGTTDATNLSLATSGTDRITILADGKVGIGMTPTTNLNVSGDIIATGAIAAQNLYASNVPSSFYGVNPDWTTGKWMRIARVNMSQQNQSFSIRIPLNSGAAASPLNAEIFLRIGQTTAMGNAPVVALEVDSSNASLLAGDVVAVVTTNSASATVTDLFIKVNNAYDQVAWTPFGRNGWFDSVDFNPAALVASLPTGTQTVGAVGTTLWKLGTGATSVSYTGNVGIGTTTPQTKLDVNGYMKLSPNGSAPAACTVALNGSIALTSQSTLCVCKGSSTSWVRASDGSTACTW